MSPAFVIVNPASAGGRTARTWPALAARLRALGLDFESAFTTGPGQATELARQALDRGHELIVAAGGDGTISETAGGFFEAGEPIPTRARLGILPTGTGGDFRRTFGIETGVEAAARTLLHGVPRAIDAGRVTFAAEGGRRVLPFVNIADAGYGGEVVHRVNRGPKFGPATFKVAALRSLLAYRNAPMVVVVDGERHELRAQQVVVANCQYFGGGMRMAPMADPGDGLLDVILVGDVSVLETLRGLREVTRGTHLHAGNPKWSQHRARRVEVSSPVPVRLDVDGEQPGMLPATFEVVPAALTLMTPAS